jgi:hypothetical protein
MADVVAILQAVNCNSTKDTQSAGSRLRCQWIIVPEEDNRYLPDGKTGTTIQITVHIHRMGLRVTLLHDTSAILEIR